MPIFRTYKVNDLDRHGATVMGEPGVPFKIGEYSFSEVNEATYVGTFKQEA